MNGWIQPELKLPQKNLILQEAKLHQCLALWNTQMSVPLSILPGREDESVAVQQESMMVKHGSIYASAENLQVKPDDILNQ